MGYGPEDFIESAVLWICRNWARQQARSWTLEQKICHKKSTVSDLSATVDFNLIHPLDYPPYSLLIYLKLLSQIVFLYKFQLLCHWSVPLTLIDLILYNLSCHWSIPLAFIWFVLVLNYVPFGLYLLLSLDLFWF